MEKGEKRKKFLEDMKQEGLDEMPHDPKDIEQARKAIERRRQRDRRLIIGAGAVGLVAAVGVAAGTRSCGKQEPEPKSVMPPRNPAIEKLDTSYELLELNSTEIEQNESKDDILRFLKNEYIENREKKRGESELTTENITFKVVPQDYVYVNTETGEIITHGESPYETMDMLEREGISYEIQKNIQMYEVLYEEEIIDAIALKGEPVLDENGNQAFDENGKVKKEIVPVKVTMGDSRYRPFEESTLMEMGEMIAKGIDYAENIEKDEVSKEMTKASFLEAFKRWKEKDEQNVVMQKDDGYEIGD